MMKKTITYLSILIAAMAFTPVYAQSEEDPWGDMDTVIEAEEEPVYYEQEEEKPVQEIRNSCKNKKEYRDDLKLLLRPYRYSSTKTTTITYRRYPQRVQVVVPIYFNYKHKMYFNLAGMPDKNISIRVYNLPKTFKKRDILFEANVEGDIAVIEIPEGNGGYRVFVEYVIPPTDEDLQNYVLRGCIIMVLGYLDPNFEMSEEGTVDTR